MNERTASPTPPDRRASWRHRLLALMRAMATPTRLALLTLGAWALLSGLYLLEVSLLPAVRHSADARPSLTFARVLDDTSGADELDFLPEEIARHCSAFEPVVSFRVEKRPDQGIEEIVVTGSRAREDSRLEDLLTELAGAGGVARAARRLAEAEQEAFVASFGARTAVDGLYRVRRDGPSSDLWHIDARRPCVHVRRLPQVHGSPPAADFVFALEWLEGMTAMRFRPVFVHLDQAVAKSRTTTVDLEIELRVDALVANPYEDEASFSSPETVVYRFPFEIGARWTGAAPGARPADALDRRLLGESTWLLPPTLVGDSLEQCARRGEPCRRGLARLSITVRETGRGGGTAQRMADLL
ncbi:MAG TPA: hypothetical protein VLA56_01130 [Pseudomonadales bacterium]|nr:hypothetical protein [Pseudomonadales bacterium]